MSFRNEHCHQDVITVIWTPGGEFHSLTSSSGVRNCSKFAIFRDA